MVWGYEEGGVHFCTGAFCSGPESRDKEGPHLCESREGGNDIIPQWFWQQGQQIGKQLLFKARGKAILQTHPHPLSRSFISKAFHSPADFS